MRMWTILSGTLACSLLIAAPAAAAPLVTYTFAGNGGGDFFNTAANMYQYSQANISGAITFDLGTAVPVAGGGLTISANIPQQTAQATVVGDSINFTFYRQFVGNFTLVVNYAAGTLNGLFPLSAYLPAPLTSNIQFNTFGRPGAIGSGSNFFVTTTVASALDNGAFVVTPVPEPATWAMLILGFGAIGAKARRRSAHRAMQHCSTHTACSPSPPSPARRW